VTYDVSKLIPPRFGGAVFNIASFGAQNGY
jgi:hypothetical protein